MTGAGRGGWHASAELIGRYVHSDPTVDEDEVWALEAHLESCPSCRGRLAETVAAQANTVTELVDGVWAGLAATVSSGPAPRPRRRFGGWLATWASPTMLPWLGMTVLVTLIALGFDLLTASVYQGAFSLFLLLAPVAPMAGVAAAWAGGVDPAYEVVAATPRSGLYLVLRRTAVVLTLLIPVLSLVGWAAGYSPVRWLLPCLAFTVGTLALGTLTGISRAAIGLAVFWAVTVVMPSLAVDTLPFVLSTASLPGWAVALVVAAVVLVARSGSFRTLGSKR